MQYQHRSCLACGKRIPRRVKGKETPVSKVFCDKGCAQYMRRQSSKSTPQAHEAKIAKTDQVNQGFLEPVFATEGPLRQWAPCAACGRVGLKTTTGTRFCDSRCESYAPRSPRKVGGEWYIVAGPMDDCAGCGLGITPRKPWGYITRWISKRGAFCSPECRAGAS